jgi:hypothetical protein
LNRRELTRFGLAFALAMPTISIIAAPSAAAAEANAAKVDQVRILTTMVSPRPFVF